MVVVALLQLKYNPTGIKLNDFLKYDAQLKHNFPIRKDNIQVGINLGGSSIPLGVSKITGTSDAKVGSYVYCTVDQKIKLEKWTLEFDEEKNVLHELQKGKFAVVLNGDLIFGNRTYKKIKE